MHDTVANILHNDLLEFTFLFTKISRELSKQKMAEMKLFCVYKKSLNPLDLSFMTGDIKNKNGKTTFPNELMHFS